MTEEISFPIQIKHIQIPSFALEMDKILCKNDWKGGWQNSSKTYLRNRLVEELGEYFAAVNRHEKTAKKELLDIANFCMMLWDKKGV